MTINGNYKNNNSNNNNENSNNNNNNNTAAITSYNEIVAKSVILSGHIIYKELSEA